MQSNCPLCGSDDLQFAINFVDSENQAIELDLCGQCKVFVPQYSRHSNKSAIAEQTEFHENWWKDSSSEEMSKTLNDVKQLINHLHHYLGKPLEDKYILEIGSGRGSLLRALLDEGYSAKGCEPSKGLVNLARKHYQLGDDVLYELDASNFLEKIVARLPAPPHTFFLWHVLEHLSEPMELINKVHQLLAVNGYLIMQLPLLSREYIYPEHYFFATHETFNSVAENSGFLVDAIEYDYDNLFVTACLRKQTGVVEQQSFLKYGSEYKPSVLAQAILLRDESIKEKNRVLDDRLESSVAMETMIVERDIHIESLNKVIDDRDHTIRSQTALIDEKVEGMSVMESMIIERDQNITGLNKLIEERDNYIHILDDALEKKNEEIYTQTKMIDERENTIRLNESIIKNIKDELERKEHDLQRIYSNFLVRVMRKAKLIH